MTNRPAIRSVYTGEICWQKRCEYYMAAANYTACLGSIDNITLKSNFEAQRV
jgi:hypothetical protein